MNAKYLKNPSKGLIIEKKEVCYEGETYREFKDFINKKKKDVNLKTRELAEKVGINYEQFRKILNLERPTKKRDCILAICLALEIVEKEEANVALRLYPNMYVLDEDKPRDIFIGSLLDGQCTNQLTIKQINKLLLENGYDELEIINGRKVGGNVGVVSDDNYKIVYDKVVTVYKRGLFEQYDSLELQYSLKEYYCISEMILKSQKDKKVVHLLYNTDGVYSVKIMEEENVESYNYTSIKETKKLYGYFYSLKYEADKRLSEIYSRLDDTKNYIERIAIKIKNMHFHIYAETYNFGYPESDEYYLFDYMDGDIIMTVHNKSEFMYNILSEEEYKRISKRKKHECIARYNGIHELEQEINNNSCSRKEIINSRLETFVRMKNLIEKYREDILQERIFVRRLEYIYEPYERDRVCEFFDVEQEYDCVLSGEYMDGFKANKKEHEFCIEDNDKIAVSLEDLYDAFKLGFDSIDDICWVKKNVGQIKNIIK